mgnify:CR=1 FL=1
MYLGDADVPYTNYTSAEYAQAEYDHMWSKVWQWACHVDHIPESGDYYVYDVGPHSALIVRTTDGTIKAYYNACMHRGTQLRGAGMDQVPADQLAALRERLSGLKVLLEP